jgi:hypothetical protein
MKLRNSPLGIYIYSHCPALKPETGVINRNFPETNPEFQPIPAWLAAGKDARQDRKGLSK